MVNNPFKNFKNPFPHLKGRKLYRSPKDGIVFGICAGLADYLQVDPVFVRLAAVVLAFFGNIWPFVLAYVVGAFLVPIDPAQDTVAPSQEPKDITPKKPEPQEKMDENQNM
jgi:phage shock protein C